MTADIDRLAALFARSFAACGASVPAAACSAAAELVGQAMAGSRRRYHTVQHALEVCAGMNGPQTLAGLFHDIVYVQIDGGFPPALAALSADVLPPADGAWRLTLPAGDPLPALCARLFGLADGQSLRPADGLNEFASALIAARVLRPHLALPQLLAVLAGIAATIPFSPTMPQTLRERLRAVAGEFAAEVDAAALDSMVADAVVLANRDVAGFAETDAGRFLARTWLLTVEANAALADGSEYSVRDYRQAIGRMAAFLGGFDAAGIFRTFAGQPTAAECQLMLTRARRNIAFACDFFASKLVTVAVIEAAALLSGGDCPISTLLGHVRELPGQPRPRIEDHLPAVACHPAVLADVLAVLNHGRPDEDPDNGLRSPLSAYVHASLGGPAVAQLFVHAQAMFAGSLAPADFLAATPAGLRSALLAGCAAQCPARREALLELAGQFVAA